jgi:hypothetical protein
MLHVTVTGRPGVGGDVWAPVEPLVAVVVQRSFAS